MYIFKIPEKLLIFFFSSADRKFLNGEKVFMSAVARNEYKLIFFSHTFTLFTLFFGGGSGVVDVRKLSPCLSNFIVLKILFFIFNFFVLGSLFCFEVRTPSVSKFRYRAAFTLLRTRAQILKLNRET